MIAEKLLPTAAMIVFLIFLLDLAVTVMTHCTLEKEKFFEIIEGKLL